MARFIPLSTKPIEVAQSLSACPSGGRVDLANISARMTVYNAPVIETGDPRFTRMNYIQAAGKGRPVLNADDGHLTMNFFEVR
jgi:hypothetical protein